MRTNPISIVQQPVGRMGDAVVQARGLCQIRSGKFQGTLTFPEHRKEVRRPGCGVDLVRGGEMQRTLGELGNRDRLEQRAGAGRF